MLPVSYQVPAAIGLVLGGAIACFSGYRLFRTVLAIYGFIAGAMIASSMMGSSNTVGMLVAAVIGGLIGSVVLFFAYFVGIALVGAGLGAFILQVGWVRMSPGDPPWPLVLGCAALGTIVALILQRYVIVMSTALCGAWTIILGALALTGYRDVTRVSASDVWILYPFTPIAGAPWVPAAWIGLGVVGMVVQLGVASRKR